MPKKSAVHNGLTVAASASSTAAQHEANAPSDSASSDDDDFEEASVLITLTVFVLQLLQRTSRTSRLSSNAFGQLQGNRINRSLLTDNINNIATFLSENWGVDGMPPGQF